MDCCLGLLLPEDMDAVCLLFSLPVALGPFQDFGFWKSERCSLQVGGNLDKDSGFDVNLDQGL